MPDTAAPTASLSMKEAVSILYLAQHEYRAESDFLRFCNTLETEGIPWDFEDARFLEKIRELREVLVARLELDNEQQLKEVAEEAYSQTLSKEELGRMEAGLEEVQKQLKTSRAELYAHTDSLVDTYIQKLKQQGPVPQEREREIRSLAHRAADRAISRGDPSVLTKELSVILSAPTELPPEITEAVGKQANLSRITEITVTAGPELHKGVFIEQCLTDSSISPEIIASKQSGAEVAKVFALSESTREAIDLELADPAKRKVAIRQAAESLQQGVGQPLNDIITAVGGPQGKQFLEDIVDSVTGNSIAEYAATGAIGGHTIVSTPETKEKIREMERSFDARRAGRKDTYITTRTFFRDAARATQTPAEQPTAPVFPGTAGQPADRQVFPSPSQQPRVFQDNAPPLVRQAAELWTPAIQRGIIYYLETSSVQITQRAPEYLHYFVLGGTDVWRAILGKAANQATSTVVKKAAATVVKKGGEKALGVVASTATGATAGSAGGPVGTIVGAIVGFVARSFIGKGLSLLWAGVKGIFSSISVGEVGKGLTQLFGGPTTPKKWYQQDSWIVPIACIAVIFLLSGFTQFRELTTTAAIVAEKAESGTDSALIEGQNTGRGFPHGEAADASWTGTPGSRPTQQAPTDYCASHPEAPVCQIITPNPNTQWPVISSNPNVSPYVTQGPAGTWSHTGSTANSVDIGAPLQSVALSPVSGTVIKTTNSYADNSGYAGSGDGGGYGNSVTIQTSDGNTLIVGHLAYNSMPGVGSTVSVGTPIGRSGNTGNSTGSHFHFGYTNAGAPSINTLFPTTIPVGCSSAASCGYIKAGSK